MFASRTAGRQSAAIRPSPTFDNIIRYFKRRKQVTSLRKTAILKESFRQEAIDMTTDEIIAAVTAICRKHQAAHLSLFGSYARGTQTAHSDIDFIVYGVPDFDALQEEIEEIPTLKRIDLFDYDEVCSDYLREDMDNYGRKIY